MDKEIVSARALNWYGVNTGDRPLLASVMIPEVEHSLKQWIRSLGVNSGVLISGLAISHWVKPRSTQDIYVLYIDDYSSPDEVPGFKRVRPHCFRNKDTHVEVEILSSEFLGLNKDLVREVVKNAVGSDGIKVASPEGLVALKLARFSRQDQADIESLMKYKGENFDMSPYEKFLSDEQKARLEVIKD